MHISNLKNIRKRFSKNRFQLITDCIHPRGSCSGTVLGLFLAWYTWIILTIKNLSILTFPCLYVFHYLLYRKNNIWHQPGFWKPIVIPPQSRPTSFRIFIDLEEPRMVLITTVKYFRLLCRIEWALWMAECLEQNYKTFDS